MMYLYVELVIAITAFVCSLIKAACLVIEDIKDYIADINN
jgi:hypothetical protein